MFVLRKYDRFSLVVVNYKSYNNNAYVKLKINIKHSADFLTSCLGS